MSIIKDFKEFAFKGNVVDMAVGVMIGAAFGKIVTSIVSDVFTPLLSVVTGRVDFTSLSVVLGEGENAPMLNYGAFLQSVIDFLVIAFFIFLMVKGIAKLRAQVEKPAAPEPPKPEPRMCPFCATAIPDSAIRCPHCTSELSVVK